MSSAASGARSRHATVDTRVEIMEVTPLFSPKQALIYGFSAPVLEVGRRVMRQLEIMWHTRIDSLAVLAQGIGRVLIFVLHLNFALSSIC